MSDNERPIEPVHNEPSKNEESVAERLKIWKEMQASQSPDPKDNERRERKERVNELDDKQEKLWRIHEDVLKQMEGLPKDDADKLFDAYYKSLDDASKKFLDEKNKLDENEK